MGYEFLLSSPTLKRIYDEIRIQRMEVEAIPTFAFDILPGIGDDWVYTAGRRIGTQTWAGFLDLGGEDIYPLRKQTF